MDLLPGFADPVLDAQATFRAVLDAMAHPGRVCRAAPAPHVRPLCASAGAVLLTLADHETPLWLDPDAAAAREWVAFHSGAPIAERESAMFLMALSLPDLSALRTGTDEAPESSATVVLQVEGFGSGGRFRLAGPGLREPDVIAIEGLPSRFAELWQQNHALFPRGVDLILCAGDTLMALPRSVSVEEV